MDLDRAHFRAWYVDPLELLYPRREAGIAVFMIALPLLERYLRQVNQRAPDEEMSPGCWRTLRELFPTLLSDKIAKDFCTAYRQGFLQQAAMSLHANGARSAPAALTHDIVIDPVTVNTNGGFVVHPVLFSRVVIRAIEQNFAVFAGAGATAPPLPRMVATTAASEDIVVPSITPNMRGG